MELVFTCPHAELGTPHRNDQPVAQWGAMYLSYRRQNPAQLLEAFSGEAGARFCAAARPPRLWRCDLALCVEHLLQRQLVSLRAGYGDRELRTQMRRSSLPAEYEA